MAIHRVQLDLTEFCNMRCYQCTRVVDDAKSDRYIPMGYIRRFVEESLDLDWGWLGISLIGGEPTLHPDIVAILNLMSGYRKYNKGCTIDLGTNGGPGLQRLLRQVPSNIVISNASGEKRGDGDPHHRDFYIAPEDLGADLEDSCCSRPYNCGIGFSVYGYLPCHICPGLVRVFDLPGAVHTLPEVTPEWFRSSIDKFCAKCGVLTWPPLWREEGQATGARSPSWKKALESYSLSKTEHRKVCVYDLPKRTKTCSYPLLDEPEEPPCQECSPAPKVRVSPAGRANRQVYSAKPRRRVRPKPN